MVLICSKVMMRVMGVCMEMRGWMEKVMERGR